MIQDAVAAASATVGTNLAAGKVYERSAVLRHLKGVALVGSAAVADCAIDVYAGTEYLGTVYNTQGGASKAPITTDFQPFDIGLEPNEQLRLVVKTAPTTNQIVWGLDLEDLG